MATLEGAQRNVTIADIMLGAVLARDFSTRTANSENFDRCPVALITQIIRISNSPCTWSVKYVSEVRSPQILKHRTPITFHYTVALSSYYLLFLVETHFTRPEGLSLST